MTLFVFIAACCILGLPFLPVIVEWVQRKDDAPLPIRVENPGELHRAAEAFVRVFKEGLKHQAAPGPPMIDVPILKLPDGAEMAINPHVKIDGLQKRQVVFTKDTTVADGVAFIREVYAIRNLTTGTNNRFNAVYCEEDVQVGPESLVVRWLHAKGRVEVAGGCQLFGSASAEKGLHLRGTIRFERLHAPRIQFGVPREEVRAGRPTVFETFVPKGVYRANEQRILIMGDLDIPSGSFFKGDVVATGAIRIGSHAKINGSIKAHGPLHVGVYGTVMGNVFSGKEMRLGEHTWVEGVASSEEKIDLATGCVIGQPDQPATVSAPVIQVQPGTVVHGTAWASETGLLGIQSMLAQAFFNESFEVFRQQPAELTT